MDDDAGDDKGAGSSSSRGDDFRKCLIDEVVAWLAESTNPVIFEKYEGVFRAQGIDVATLTLHDTEDSLEHDLGIENHLHRRRLLLSLQQLLARPEDAASRDEHAETSADASSSEREDSSSDEDGDDDHGKPRLPYIAGGNLAIVWEMVGRAWDFPEGPLINCKGEKEECEKYIDALICDSSEDGYLPRVEFDQWMNDHIAAVSSDGGAAGDYYAMNRNRRDWSLS